MKRIRLIGAMAALALLGCGAAEDGRVTVILEDNVSQAVETPAGRPSRNAAATPQKKAYQGDSALHDAFRSLQTRLQTILVSSGRVEVMTKADIDKAATRERVYLCSYELTQGQRMDGQYIIGISLQAWNYLNGESSPLAELTRSVDLKIPAETPEIAFAFASRYLAYLTLEKLAPVTVLELKGTRIRVGAGDQLLKKGDQLQIGDAMDGTAFARVAESDGATSIAELTGGDLSIVKAGAACRFVLPDTVREAGVATEAPPPKDIVVRLAGVSVFSKWVTVDSYELDGRRVKGTPAREQTVKIGKVSIPVQQQAGTPDRTEYTAKPRQMRFSLADLPDKLNLKLRTELNGAGVNLLAAQTLRRGQADTADYALACVISEYAETHSGPAAGNGTLAFLQESSMTVHVTLTDNHRNGVAAVDTDVKASLKQAVTNQRMNPAEALAADCARQIAAAVQGAVTKR